MAKGRKTGGRRAGTPNRISGTLKDMILQALSDAGGIAYLRSVAETNPAAFLQLVGKILPLQVKEAAADPLMPKTVFHVRVPWRDEEQPTSK